MFGVLVSVIYFLQKKKVVACTLPVQCPRIVRGRARLIYEHHGNKTSFPLGTSNLEAHVDWCLEQPSPSARRTWRWSFSDKTWTGELVLCRGPRAGGANGRQSDGCIWTGRTRRLGNTTKKQTENERKKKIRDWCDDLTQSAFRWWSHRARWTEARVVTSTGSPQVRQRETKSGRTGCERDSFSTFLNVHMLTTPSESYQPCWRCQMWPNFFYSFPSWRA
jgi:hypothetical protein